MLEELSVDAIELLEGARILLEADAEEAKLLVDDPAILEELSVDAVELLKGDRMLLEAGAAEEAKLLVVG